MLRYTGRRYVKKTPVSGKTLQVSYFFAKEITPRRPFAQSFLIFRRAVRLTFWGAVWGIMRGWHQIGAKLTPHDSNITNMAPNLSKRLPNLGRDGFETSYSQCHSNDLARVYPSPGTMPGRFVECSSTWHHIGTNLARHWCQIGAKLTPNVMKNDKMTPKLSKRFPN